MLNVLYHKFRRWQADPYPKRELTGEKHVCHNCETEFEGNFCPICGQDASLGNADWKAMEEEVKALTWLMNNLGWSSWTASSSPCC